MDELKRLVGLSDRVRSDEEIRALIDDVRRSAERMRQRVRAVYDKYPLPEGLADLLEPEADR